jgi:hypothetical protein
VERTSGSGEGGCFVCAKHFGKIAIPGGAIYQDDLLYVGHRAALDGGSDTYLGYVMVETRRHASGVADLTRFEAHSRQLSGPSTCTRLCLATTYHTFMSMWWHATPMPHASSGGFG